MTPFLRETRVSRKEIFPLHSVSMVNEMFVSIEFRVSWKAETSFFLMMQKLSSTYLFQILGGTDELLIADSSISSITKIGRNGADRTTHRTAMDLFVNSVIEHKIVVGQGELKKCSDIINVQICS